ncbi:Gfo/Idh/MocA family protein [Parapedobacter indicus]|uniref:Predicted dehydrogenase n=1 Tax=Parapedobacter indicus TaxID=1477437 RepID=A0A1I3FS22_9SPHI|nr:Gfo/Idh/MocA family oxidoreductase [Parapedobacter indicus]PPL03865.1 putative dehydrogenase [Parapedobacter indicus]SFI14068.1 Predicted dehydrogenase [Parapedobacter indicus]
MDRRKFITNASLAAAGIGMAGYAKAVSGQMPASGKRVGIIGLDTSHSMAFTKGLNDSSSALSNSGYRVTAAYPYGSTIEVSTSRIPGYLEQIKPYGVKIVDSIRTLLAEVDYVLLETNDGNPRLQQAIEVIEAGKPVFIDKPVAASFEDVRKIYNLAEKRNVPVFSTSSLRYMGTIQDAINGKIGKILGADTYSPATIEPHHPDLFWYGIHGVESLIALMGVGCKELSRVHTEGTDIVVGTWADGRIGTFRGTRTGKHTYGGTAYGEQGDLTLGPYKGYDTLLSKIIEFFDSGQSPVDANETLEIYRFMTAADLSKARGGAKVALAELG